MFISAAGIICKPAKYYSDHMVLQREPQGAVLWGYSEPGYAVNVTFKGVNYTTKAELGTANLSKRPHYSRDRMMLLLIHM